MSRFFTAIDPKIHRKVKELFVSQCPVFYKGIEYTKIQALKYVYIDKSIKLKVELIDVNKNSVLIVTAEQIEKEN